MNYAMAGSVKIPAMLLCGLGNECESFTPGEITLFLIEAD